MAHKEELGKLLPFSRPNLAKSTRPDAAEKRELVVSALEGLHDIQPRVGHDAIGRVSRHGLTTLGASLHIHIVGCLFSKDSLRST